MQIKIFNFPRAPIYLSAALLSSNSLSVSVTTLHCQGRRRPTSTPRAGAARVTATPLATPTLRGAPARMRRVRTAAAPAATVPATPARR